MTDPAQSWETEEEAVAALHAYAQQYADREEDPSQYEVFLGGHQVFEFSEGKYVIALKLGQSPFTFA